MRTLCIVPEKEDALLSAIYDGLVASPKERIFYTPNDPRAFTRLCENVRSDDVVVGFSLAARWIAERNFECLGYILLGFPFHEKGTPRSYLGKASLLTSTKPTLVLQGERDPYGSASAIKRACAAQNNVKVRAIPNGNHRFLPKKNSGFEHSDNIRKVIAHIEDFLSALKASAK